MNDVRGSNVVKLWQSRTVAGALSHILSSFVYRLDGISARMESSHSAAYIGTASVHPGPCSDDR